MACTKAYLIHPDFRGTKIAPVGFSWTVLLFGFFVPLIRSDWKNAAIIFVAQVVIGAVFLPFAIVSLVIFAALYNKMYITDLLNAGYSVGEYDGPHGDTDYVYLYVGRRPPGSSSSRPPEPPPPPPSPPRSVPAL